MTMNDAPRKDSRLPVNSSMDTAKSRPSIRGSESDIVGTDGEGQQSAVMKRRGSTGVCDGKIQNANAVYLILKKDEMHSVVFLG